MPLRPFNYAFFGYFFFFVFAIGGLGIWYSLYEVLVSPEDDGYKLARGVATYFIAVWTTAFLDINMVVKLKSRVSTLIYSFAFFGVAVFLLILCFQIDNDYVFFPACLGLLGALFLWYIANADSEKFDEENFYNQIKQEAEDKGHGDNW